MKVFGLIAVGPLLSFNSSGDILSKKLFHSKEKAANYIDEFTKIASERRGKLTDLERVDRVIIMEFELGDE